MNIAAYCRVSTGKEDQLNSLEVQKQYFQDYAERNHHRLVHLYADEGISGTKISKREQFKQMLDDAERGCFDLVVVKDISRFARNTVDLLESVRKLKRLGIEVQFLTANMTSMGDSEFVLTMMGALAQEESANTSKRVKFGKKVNAEKGRVPNLVYGYDKINGEYFTMDINQEEAAVIRQIFRWYIDEGYGGSKIASMLNQQGFRTKRGCNWTQNSVCGILNNELYTGKVINGKQEVTDFLSGKRTDRDQGDWLVVDRPELRIISQEDYDRAQQILHQRNTAFKTNKTRHSNQYLFSTLIRCKDCGWSFRRTVRHYKNTYVRWCCSCHNQKGAGSCPNGVTVDEDGLIDVLQNYFKDILSHTKQVTKHIVAEFERVYKAQDQNIHQEKDLKQRIAKLKKSREKYMNMYADDLITREELNERIGKSRLELQRLENELLMVRQNLTKGAQLERILNDTFRQMESIVDVRQMTNAQLKRIVKEIQVDHEGNVEIHLHVLGDLWLRDSIPVGDNRT